MRDIRGDLQDRASFLEEQISAAQSDYEKAAERLAQEHQARVGDLQAELEAVTTLLEGEYRRHNAPVGDERRQAPPREVEPARREAPRPQPQQQHRAPVAEERRERHERQERHGQHERREPEPRQPEREPYRRPTAVEAEPGREAAPAEAAQPARQPSEAQFERRPAPAREPDTYRRPAAAAQPRRQERSEDPESRPAAPQVYRRAPIAPERERREAPAAQAHPQQPPLADYLIRKLSEGGAMALEDLCHAAVQDGYFAEGENPERGVQLTLMNVVKAGFIRQLPNGAFAPATVMDTIRLRRAI